MDDELYKLLLVSLISYKKDWDVNVRSSHVTGEYFVAKHLKSDLTLDVSKKKLYIYIPRTMLYVTDDSRTKTLFKIVGSDFLEKDTCEENKEEITIFKNILKKSLDITT